MTDDTLQRTLDRLPPPDVPPVVRDGIRYEPVMGDPPQVGGLIAACDAASGRHLWTLAVFDNIRQPGLEGDVQDVFVSALRFDADGVLHVTDEHGRHWLVDVAARTSAPAPQDPAGR